MKLNTKQKRLIKKYIKETARQGWYAVLSKQKPLYNIEITDKGIISFIINTNDRLNYYTHNQHNPDFTDEKPVRKRIQKHNIQYQIDLTNKDNDFLFNNGIDLIGRNLFNLMKYVLVDAEIYFIMDRHMYFDGVYHKFPLKKFQDFLTGCVIRYNMLVTFRETIWKYNNEFNIPYRFNPDERGWIEREPGETTINELLISEFDSFHIYDPIRLSKKLPSFPLTEKDEEDGTRSNYYQKYNTKEYFLWMKN